MRPEEVMGEGPQDEPESELGELHSALGELASLLSGIETRAGALRTRLYGPATEKDVTDNPQRPRSEPIGQLAVLKDDVHNALDRASRIQLILSKLERL